MGRVSSSLQQDVMRVSQKRTYPAGNVKPCLNFGGALDRRVEHSKRKALCQHADLKVDVGCCWNIHVDSGHWQPHEKLFCLNSFQAADGAELEFSRDVLVVIYQLGIANKQIKISVLKELYIHHILRTLLNKQTTLGPGYLKW